jgi:chromosome segregation ATPase
MENQEKQSYTSAQLDGFSKASELSGRASALEKQARELRQASQEIDSAATAGASGEAINRIFNKATAAPESTVPNFAQKYAGIIRRITDRLRMREEHKASLAAFKAERPDELMDIDKLAKAVRNDEEMIHDYLQSLEALQGEAQAFPVEYLQSLRQAVDDATTKLQAAESKIADMQGSLKSAVKAARTTIEQAKAVARQKNRALDAKVPGPDPLLLMGQPSFHLPKPTAPVEPGSHQDGPARATASAKSGSSIFSALRGSSGAGRSGIGRGSL